MTQKVCLLFLLSFFSLNLYADEVDKTGYALLDKIVITFRDLAQHGSGGIENVDSLLEEMMADAIKAREDNKVDLVFFRRYNRLLMVLKLSIVEDDKGILSSLIEREVSSFVLDVKGEKANVQGKEAIGTIASAIADEILNLHLYLDNRERRDELMKEFIEKSTIKK